MIKYSVNYKTDPLPSAEDEIISGLSGVCMSKEDFSAPGQAPEEPEFPQEPANESVSMVILAGGKSSRMGTDKCDLKYQGLTFLEHQIQKGRRLGIRDILVSGYHGSRCSVPVIPDRFPEKGPLGGLEACLRKARNPRCLVLSVDVPLLDPADLSGLIAAGQKSTAAAVLLQHGERLEPLIGVYRTDLCDAMAESAVHSHGSVLGVLRPLGFEIYTSASPEDTFMNINDPETYRKLFLTDNPL